MKKRWKKLGTGIGLLAAAAGIALAVYAGDYYRASETAMAALIPDEAVEVETLSGGVAFVPREVEAGLIFYPGGKVEHTAYAPLMRALAEEGVLCVITKMPLNLAVLDANAADGWQERYPWWRNGTSAVTLWAGPWRQAMLRSTQRTMRDCCFWRPIPRKILRERT